jgi:hypothetical protein
LDRWIDQSPRVTKDLDLIAGIDLIASQEQQLRIDAALKKHSFAIVEGNALWQFKKQIDSEKSVLLEFHTPPPETARNDVQYDERRVKPKPSLGKLGIQGRTNPEAIAARLHPFAFSLHGLEIVIPNAVTLAIMMLTAAADRRQHSQNPEKSAEARQFAGSQAEKHANDVWRVIAMATRNESDHATEILNSIRTTSVYARASTSYRELFGEDNAWGATVATGSWRDEDFRVIRTVIESWFR